MGLVASAGLILGSVVMLGCSIVCSVLSPPLAPTAHDYLVVATGVAGLALGAMAVREMRELRAQLDAAARRAP